MSHQRPQSRRRKKQQAIDVLRLGSNLPVQDAAAREKLILNNLLHIRHVHKMAAEESQHDVVVLLLDTSDRDNECWRKVFAPHIGDVQAEPVILITALPRLEAAHLAPNLQKSLCNLPISVLA